MSTRQRSRLVNFNRLLILALTLTGLLMDGVQHSDLPFTVALVVWLWLAVFARMEAEILGGAKRLPTGTRDRAGKEHHANYKGRWDGALPKTTNLKPIT